ncbi:MAG: hypothetical protein NT031_05185, partial [Planctomycetota bacterium]|nr:hypothetical protein [Planctomycetota bacterium]
DWTDGAAVIGGGNLPGPLASQVVLSNNLVRVVGKSISNLSLTISSSNGLFSGTFIHPVTRKSVTVKGALLQDPASVYSIPSSGWFLGTNQGGGILLGPGLTTNDFSISGFSSAFYSGDELSNGPWLSVAIQGFPESLVANQPLQGTFLLLGGDGALLAVDGPARVILLDSRGQPVAFSYSMTPNLIYFSHGVANASLTINTKGDLTGCFLAVVAD